MLDAQFEAALDLIHQGAGRAPLQRLIDVAQHIARVPIVYLVARERDCDRIIVSNGIPHIPLLSPRLAADGTAFLYDQPQIIERLRHDPRLRDHVLVTEKGWRWLATIPLPMPMLEHRVTLVCADLRERRPATHDVLERLRQLSAVIVDQLDMLGLIAQHMSKAAQLEVVVTNPSTPERRAPRGESPEVVTDFLLATLVERHRVLTRSETAYHALVTWRAPIKDAQIAALRALKRDPPPALIEQVAQRLAVASHRLFDGVPKAVVAVPCGNSGEACLANKLAKRVAELLGVVHYDAFAAIPVTGSSHPRRNVARPNMRLIEPPSGPVLLIDDVATSGSHLAEASELLRASGAAVFALVWLAG